MTEIALIIFATLATVQLYAYGHKRRKNNKKYKQQIGLNIVYNKKLMTLSVFANLPHKTRVVVKGRGGMVMVNGILEGSDKQHNIQLQDTLPSGNYILKLENSRWRVSQGFEITPIDTTLLRG